MFYNSYFLSKNLGFYIKCMYAFDINAHTCSEVIKELRFSIKVPDCILNFVFLWHGMHWEHFFWFSILPYSAYSKL